MSHRPRHNATTATDNAVRINTPFGRHLTRHWLVAAGLLVACPAAIVITTSPTDRSTELVVATRDIAPGTFISSDRIEAVVTVADRLVNDGYITRAQSETGLIAARGIRAGQALTASAVLARPSQASNIAGEHGAPGAPIAALRTILAGLIGVGVIGAVASTAGPRIRRRRTVAHEAGIVAAADIPFVAWVGQQLAALGRQLNPAAHRAAPVAVELDPEAGIEILWDRAEHRAPAPWEPTHGGWSWRVLYDPDEPTAIAEWPSPIPSLVTVGTRDGRQLLIDLENVGVFAVAGPPEQVDAWTHAVILELGSSDELADVNVVSVGADRAGIEHLERVSTLTPDEAIAQLDHLVRDAADLLGGHDTMFHCRLGPGTTFGARPVVVVCGDVSAADQTRIAAAAHRHRGVAVIVTADIDQPGAHLTLDNSGTGALHGIGDHPIHITPVGTPRETTAHPAVPLGHEQQPHHDPTRTQLLGEPPSDGVPAAPTAAAGEQSPPSAAASDLDLETLGQWLNDREVDPDDDWQPPEPAILVRVLGRPTVPDRPDIQGLRLRLLVYLACNNGAAISTSRVRDAVWAGAARERKTFSNKLSELRNALGTTPTGDSYITLTATGIQLDQSVMTDLHLFTTLTARAASAATNEAIELLRTALALVDGEPFDDAGYEWAEANQSNHQAHEHIATAARHLYQLACDATDLTTARYALTQGLKAAPGHEDLYRLRMQLEHHAGNTTAIHTTFNELTHQLNTLDCQPSTETVNLYRQLVGRRHP